MKQTSLEWCDSVYLSASQVAQWLRILPPVQETQETWAQPRGGGDALEKEKANHFSTLGKSHGQRNLGGCRP